MEHLIDIPGRLHSVAVEKHVAGTDQIYDDILKTTQDILNLENITDVKVQEGKLQFLNIQGQVLKEISITTEQKQSDWNQTDSTQIDFIKNKPIIYNKQEVDNKLITKQDIIDDIATIRSNAQAGATAYHKPQTGIPATDLASDVQSNLVNIVDIAQVIPEQASESNQLADKNFVNSSVATNTANYISDNGQPFQSLEHLEAYEGILTNNDYAFIVGADSAGNTTYSRYKYKASTHQWALEYILNNSSFTAEQWESISSGITSGLVAKLSAMPTNSELTTILNGKVDTADLSEYTKQVASEISHEQKYTGRHTITDTIHQIVYPTNNYRKTEIKPEWIRVVDARGEDVKSIRMHFDDNYNPQIETLDDKVVWQNTATQQIPAATTEANGLMSASDKSKLDALPTATELAQELGGKANSADLAEVATSGSYNDLTDKPTIPAAQVQSDWNEGDTTSKAYIKNKPTIPTVPTNVSAFINDAGYITASGVANKQDKMPIVQVTSGVTSIDAAVNTYYKVEDAVNDMAITLPTPTDTSKISMVVIALLAGTTPNVVIGSTATIDYSAAYDISAGNEYEINCLFNGNKWIVADMEVL